MLHLVAILFRRAAIAACVLSTGVWIGVREPWRQIVGNYGKYPASRSIPNDVGTQLELLYVGASTCTWSNRPELVPALDQVVDALQSTATARKARLVVVGVALDLEPGPGLRHLAQFGAFNEVSAGLGRANSTALATLWEGFGPPAATPQLLLVERRVVRENHYPDTLYTVRGERLLARKVGFYEILKWASAGAPVAAAESSRPIASLPNGDAAWTETRRRD